MTETKTPDTIQMQLTPAQQVMVNANNALESLRGFYAPSLSMCYEQAAKDTHAIQQLGNQLSQLQQGYEALRVRAGEKSERTREFVAKLNEFKSRLPSDCSSDFDDILQSFHALGLIEK